MRWVGSYTTNYHLKTFGDPERSKILVVKKNKNNVGVGETADFGEYVSSGSESKEGPLVLHGKLL